MKTKLIIISILFCIAANSIHAQWYSQGSDAGSTRWSQIETDAFKVIYPRGLDSLAKVYATRLEANRPKVGWSIGGNPGDSYRSKTPVILHTQYTVNNGLVTWAPRRMELFTVPDAYHPISMSTPTHLALHESRHVAQMENYHNYPFRWLNVLFGDMAVGALSAVYGGQAFFEGDAVTAETALTASGRGRSAEFLEYLRASFDEGQYRNYWQWRWGSLSRFTPDYYRIGYVSIAGMRAYLDAPDFTSHFYRRLSDHHGFAFYNLQKTALETTGKPFKEGMDEILHKLGDEWKADADARGPFYESEQLTQSRRHFTEYSQLAELGNVIYAVRSGIDQPASLVCISPDGTETRLCAFSGTASRLKAGDGRIYWSEFRGDARWELRSFSDIYYLDRYGQVQRLTKREKYFNPVPAGSAVAVVEYPERGGSNIVFLDTEDGHRIKSIAAPDGFQFVEIAWDGSELFASALSDEGFGLFRVSDFSCILVPQHSQINNLDARNGRILFTADLGGVTEMYSVNISTGEAVRWTNTRNGAKDFIFLDGGKSLAYTVLTADGRNIHKTALSNLKPVAVDFSRQHEYPMAVKLSAQENAPEASEDVKVSEPRNYSKLGHLIKFHSWAPVFVNADAIKTASFEDITTNAGLGATAFFQNDLGSAWGSIGYHADVKDGVWNHSGHAKFTYSGWLPVLEASVDFNDRKRTESIWARDKDGKDAIRRYSTETPFLTYSAKAYIPLKFNSNGVLRGFTPQVRFSGSNDIFLGKPMMTLSASLRGYTMLPTAPSGIYPRWGIGAEIGYNIRPTQIDNYCQTAYGMVYAYIPGFARTHGIRLSGLYARILGEGMYVDAVSSMSPRGFDPSALSLIAGHRQQAKFTADYAMPFGSVDWAGLCPWFYLRNFELVFHFDYSVFSSPKHSGDLYSAGADFKLHLSNFLWIPFDTHVGVSYNYNGGSSFEELTEKMSGTGRNAVSLIFGIDM